jgi:hypothetical protein
MPDRVRVDGKHLILDGRPFKVRGVTYGSFLPRLDGELFPERTHVKEDFRKIVEAGLNTVRVYSLPPVDVLDLAEEYGLDRTTSYLYLVWSPVLDRIATNRYAIRGADIPAGTLEAMRESHRRRRVQQGHGWSKSGLLWIAYTLSQAVLDTNVVGVPGVLRNELQGKYELQPDNEHLGEVATDGQNLWGLGRLLRRKGAEVGDVLILEFDLVARKCAVGGGLEVGLADRMTAARDRALSAAVSPDRRTDEHLELIRRRDDLALDGHETFSAVVLAR